MADTVSTSRYISKDIPKTFRRRATDRSETFAVAEFAAQIDAVRTPRRQSWSFARKFQLWLTDHQQTLNGFAKKHGFAQSTMHGWIKQDGKVPHEALARIAVATKLPVDWWIRDDVGYPPPLDYDDGLAERAVQALRTLTPSQVRWVVAKCEDRAALDRQIAIDRASREQ